MQEWHGAKDTAVRASQGQGCSKNPERKPEGINGTRNRSLMEQLRLGSEATSGGLYRKALLLRIVKGIAGSSVRIRKMRH
jgi:hypothetical protein